MKHSQRKKLVVWATVVGAFALIVYLGIAGRAGSWPQTKCSIVGSRVVRADAPIGQHGAPLVMYEGEYQIRYTLAGRDYFLWVFAGWLDKDRQFVVNKVAFAEQQDCTYSCPLQPSNPKEAVADR